MSGSDFRTWMSFRRCSTVWNRTLIFSCRVALLIIFETRLSSFSSLICCRSRLKFSSYSWEINSISSRENDPSFALIFSKRIHNSFVIAASLCPVRRNIHSLLDNFILHQLDLCFLFIDDLLVFFLCITTLIKMTGPHIIRLFPTPL